MSYYSIAIEAAWLSAIWTNDTILEMTPKIYQYDISAQSEFDVDKLCYEGQVNVFLAKTQRRREDILAQQTRYTYTVAVEYYLQQTDVAESTYNEVRDRLEVLDDLVRTELGKTWDSTVDFYQGAQPLPIREVEISERKCWFGGLTYTAFKTT